jgi:hypothetical protein
MAQRNAASGAAAGRIEAWPDARSPVHLAEFDKLIAASALKYSDLPAKLINNVNSWLR